MNHKPLFLFSILVFFLACSSNKKETTKPAIKSITESVYASGFIKSKNQYEVFGKSNGVIEKIFVSEATQVKKGDPIFQLDNRNLRIATKNAKLASTASDFKKNRDKLMDAEKAIEMAAKQLSNDSLLFQRQKKLWNQRIGSKVDFERKELRYENAKVNLDRANTNYEDVKRQLKLASDQGKNNLEIAQLIEDDYIVRSEVDGVVYKINKEIGELINGQEPAAIIGTDAFVIELNIDEFDIVRVKKGQQVIIRMDSYKSEVFEAKIIAIEPMMNIRTRSFQAEAIFTKKPEELFPNLTVEANIIINTKQEALTIPRNYLLNDSTILLKGGAVQIVKTGLMDYDLVEIKSGIDTNTTLELPEE